jgi:ATP synthase protein I
MRVVSLSRDYWKYAKYANFAMSFGITMALSLFLGYYGGNWLDQKLGTAPFGLVTGLMAGAGLAFYSMLKELKALERMDRPKDKDD